MITRRRHIGWFLCSSRNWKCMTVHPRSRSKSIKPIHIIIIFNSNQFWCWKYFIIRNIFSVTFSSSRVFPCKLDILLSIHHIGSIHIIFKSNGTIITDFRSSGFSSFGSHDYNSIRSSGTINSCRRGILQYINLFNVIRIDVFQFSTRNTINYNQWFGTTTNCIQTTNQDIIPTTRLIRWALNIDTRHYALHSTSCTGDTSSRQFFCRNRSYGTRQIRFLNCAITHYNNFIKHFCIFFQHYLI